MGQIKTRSIQILFVAFHLVDVEYRYFSSAVFTLGPCVSEEVPSLKVKKCVFVKQKILAHESGVKMMDFFVQHIVLTNLKRDKINL